MTQHQHSENDLLKDGAYLGIQKYFYKTIRYERKVLEDKDPENLHQMRVGMRCLRSAVTGFAPIVRLPAAMENKPIGKMAGVLGQLRDLDVLQEIMQSYQPHLISGEKRLLTQALKASIQQRSKAFKQVKKLLRGKKYQHFKQSVETWLQDPHYQEYARLSVSSTLPDLLLPCINQLLLHPGWWVGVKIEGGQVKRINRLTLKTAESQISDREDVLHDLRKQAKRVRYQMNLFSQYYGSDYQDYIMEMKRIQEVLGKIQDTLILEAFLDRVLPPNWRQKGPKLTKQLMQDRYQAWKAFYKLQQKYLSAEGRQGLRQAAIAPLTLPSALNGSDRTELRYDSGELKPVT
ncbi:CHAD domain-containing protein [Roseofilum casamattae]|uniref:CHAD domain-containing protein n=1 Tax=Roseofilum casamattae BLCC-M143 TaxID=3022442 RepID=A0ABT7BY28_9CYAN|nr:CHAD domain-containing protein [Roseofilum casamattae]MDJ1183424.1 CHAD domain-containing protein [Roseofilum casamattae BLCC-M143]